MSYPPPLPSRLPPKFTHPKPSPTPGSNSSKYSDSYSSQGDTSSSASPHSRRPPVAPRKIQRPPASASDVNGTTTSPLPPIQNVMSRAGPAASVEDAGLAQEGFGHCLQQGYEAITKKHEDELLALESLRGHIFHRARADKEYAENLAKMNQKASKKVSTIDQSSAVIKVLASIHAYIKYCNLDNWPLRVEACVEPYVSMCVRAYKGKVGNHVYTL